MNIRGTSLSRQHCLSKLCGRLELRAEDDGEAVFLAELRAALLSRKSHVAIKILKRARVTVDDAWFDDHTPRLPAREA